jgi:hypothetical protein
MCLATVSEGKPNPTGFGWKVFRVVANSEGRPKYRGPGTKLFSENRGSREYDYNTWYQAVIPSDEPMLRTKKWPYQDYQCGFHIALSRKDAREFIKTEPVSGKNLVVRKVEYRGAHTAGVGTYFFPGKQVIAEEIRILPEFRPKRIKE